MLISWAKQPQQKTGTIEAHVEPDSFTLALGSPASVLAVLSTRTNAAEKIHEATQQIPNISLSLQRPAS